MLTLADIKDAAALIRPHVPPTPQYHWPLLAQHTGAETFVKHENHTPTGSFKARGSLTYIHHVLHAGARPPGLVTATRGNHGQSIAFAAARHAIPITIVVPHGNAREKNAAMRAWGANLIEHGPDFDSARAHALALAASENLHFVPNYHPALVLGVATYALEFLTALPHLHTIYVPIGQGSGIAAMIAVRDLLGHQAEIVGVVSTHADAYATSFETGTLTTTETAETIADGVACRVPIPEALATIRAGAARILRVTEPAIRAAICAYHGCTHNTAEGAGALPLAALMQEREKMAGIPVGLPLCGGNIDRGLFAEILSQS